VTPEGRVKEAIKKYLTAKGVWFAGKASPPTATGWMYMPVTNGMGVTGIPDFCGVYKGRPLYIEAKADASKKPTDNQLQRHKEIRAAGGIVIVAHSVEQLEVELQQQGL
jgi:penicillin-binding protein-related factor A (putative recombinase)